MGLDMTLYQDHESIKNLEDFDNYYFDTPEYAYWRKANMIHKYFCDNGIVLEDRILYRISRKLVENLVVLCAQVLYGGAKPKETLPTYSEFFFGSSNYDDDYRYDLAYTLKKLTDVLEEHSEDKSFLYYASW